jgi:formylglycine-generating enzyme required for sulfatase activity
VGLDRSGATNVRDVDLGTSRPVQVERAGRNVIAVIGIDSYRWWSKLRNAVSDALGSFRLFQQLGFEVVAAPLIDEAATGAAIRRLVTDDLATLGSDDGLVLFFAGHGTTTVRELPDGIKVKTGYIIPVDGSNEAGHVATWIRLDAWLDDLARLPARHILVIIDACHSGIALDSLIKWRDANTWRTDPLDKLRRRRSRRIITSALDDQLAMDGGPIPGHSLFTGCLIQALSGDLNRSGRSVTTGSEVGVYLRQRVATFPNSTQTPDYGALAFDDRGELVIPILCDVPAPVVPPDEIGSAAASSTRPSSQRVWLAGARSRRMRVLVLGASSVLAVAVAMRAAWSPGTALPAEFADAPALDVAPLGAAIDAPDAGPRGWILITGGRFMIGSSDDEIAEARRVCGTCRADLFEREGPPREVTIPTFEIQRTEVTVEAFVTWLRQQRPAVRDGVVTAGGQPQVVVGPTTVEVDGAELRVPAAAARLPITRVTHAAARAYCGSLGGDLPSQAQWERAARGDSRRLYPWGSIPPRCDGVVFGREQLGLCGGSGPSDVGTARQDVTPDGVHDVGGNVAEWTREGFTEHPSEREVLVGDAVAVRGGSYGDVDLRGASRGRLARDNVAPQVGFRCVRPGGGS